MNYYQPDPTNVMGRRIGAFVIDLVLIWGIAFGLFAALADPTTYQDARFLGLGCDAVDDDQYICFENEDNGDITVLERDGTIVAVLVLIGAWAGNFIVLQGTAGGSVGKLLTGLRVVDGNGRRAGFGRVLVRSLFLLVDFYLCFVIGLVTSLVSKGHRRVGDMVGGTYVVKAVDMNRSPLEPGPPAPTSWTPPPTAGWNPPGAPPPGASPPLPPAAAPGWGAPPPAAPPPPAPGWGTPPPPAPPPDPQ